MVPYFKKPEVLIPYFKNWFFGPSILKAGFCFLSSISNVVEAHHTRHSLSLQKLKRVF
jgi:hypothetical protein